MNPESPRPALIAASAALLVVSVLVGLLLSEIGFRIFLYHDATERFVRPAAKQLGVYDKSHWEFDEQFGYVYPPKRVIAYTNLSNGVVDNCQTVDVINEMGNIGPIVGDYQSADIKIAVFGDSWTAFNINQRTWTHFLQDELQAATGKTVHVLNFGRDGYGILQMFDLAAAKVEEFKPDIAIIAFITNDLARVRTWRTVVGAGGQQRILTTFEPNPHPDLSTAYDTFIVNPAATSEWCRSMKGTKQANAPVLDEIQASYNRARNVGGSLTADIWTWRHSYLWSRIVSGNPFDGLETTFFFPSLDLNSYALDAQFIARVAKLKSMGTRVVLFHMAFYPEVKIGEEYIVNYREASLLKSLAETTGWTIHGTLPYVSLPVDQPERMNAAPDNYHPSLWGMEFYAKTATRMLKSEGHVK
jgi:hypothetical protein